MAVKPWPRTIRMVLHDMYGEVAGYATYDTVTETCTEHWTELDRAPFVFWGAPPRSIEIAKRIPRAEARRITGIIS